MPCSSMRFTIIGTAVKIPIWNRNWVLSADSKAGFCRISLFLFNDASTPESACINIGSIIKIRKNNNDISSINRKTTDYNTSREAIARKGLWSERNVFLVMMDSLDTLCRTETHTVWEQSSASKTHPWSLPPYQMNREMDITLQQIT